MHDANAPPPHRLTEPDGTVVEQFVLPDDHASLEELLRDLFQNHWREITFGPVIEGAAWEFTAPGAPTTLGMLDGYLTVAFGTSHFHLCIGPTQGIGAKKTPAHLAEHRKTSRAVLFRSLDPDGVPKSWGLRLWNGAGEQQLTVYLPNPLLTPDGQPAKTPDWSRLALWDALRKRWTGAAPDPRDRTAKYFRH